MKRGICLGYAEPIYDVINGSTPKDEAFDIRKAQLPFMKDSDPSKTSETPIPDHLKALYERSVKGLAQDQVTDWYYNVIICWWPWGINFNG
jgi:hypothetical protein